MKEFIVNQSCNNKNIVSTIKKEFPRLNQNTIFKALRNKDIRVNGIRIKEDIKVCAGDKIDIYISDEMLLGIKTSFNVETKSIAYQDDNFIIYDKPLGIEVQGNENEIGLEEAIKEFFNLDYIKACHRLDRNTCGLVIFAKNSSSENKMLDAIKKHQVRKFYKAHVYGEVARKEESLIAYLFKDSKSSKVIISDTPKKGYQKIITNYTLLKRYKDGSSLLEVEIVTGKTHQIRAHLAHIGLPIIGDGKYGVNSINKAFGKKYQELKSYKIVFGIKDSDISYLNDITIQI